jgi:hypothetical protein
MHAIQFVSIPFNDDGDSNEIDDYPITRFYPATDFRMSVFPIDKNIVKFQDKFCLIKIGTIRAIEIFGVVKHYSFLIHVQINEPVRKTRQEFHPRCSTHLGGTVTD